MISVVVIAKNEEGKIGDALASVKDLADEILVLDGGSTDKTIAIASKAKAKVVKQKGKSYSDWRNQGIKEAEGDWIFYLDADERVTPELKQEIRNIMISDKSQCVAYAIPRKNIIFGREMKHGGWWPDYVKRLFKKAALGRWVGELHEDPVFEGELGHLKSALVHLKHNNISEMIAKTNKWSVVEAKLLFGVGHPKMTWWRFFRIMTGELWYRLIVKKGFLDGTEGTIYSIYQMFSRYVTYVKLWEMQNDSKLKT